MIETERAAWVRFVKADRALNEARDRRWQGRDAPCNAWFDRQQEAEAAARREYVAARDALHDLGVDVEALLARRS